MGPCGQCTLLSLGLVYGKNNPKNIGKAALSKPYITCTMSSWFEVSCIQIAWYLFPPKAIRPRGYIFSPYSTQLSTKFQLSIKIKYRQINKFLDLSLSDVVFIMLINIKMPTIVGILTLMSRINFVLSWVEHLDCWFLLNHIPYFKQK